MEKHYEERFQAQLRLDEKIAPLMEINDILYKMKRGHVLKAPG